MIAESALHWLQIPIQQASNKVKDEKMEDGRWKMEDESNQSHEGGLFFRSLDLYAVYMLAHIRREQVSLVIK